MQVTLQLLDVTCAGCGRDATVGVMPDGVHGQFVLRSAGSTDEVFLDAMHDPTYDEVEALIGHSRRLIGKDAWFRAHALQRTYGEIACDPDSAGSFFNIGKLPNCPLCGHAVLHSWRPTVPPRFTQRQIPPATHHRWDALSSAEKAFRVDDVLAARGF